MHWTARLVLLALALLCLVASVGVCSDCHRDGCCDESCASFDTCKCAVMQAHCLDLGTVSVRLVLTIVNYVPQLHITDIFRPPNHTA